MGSALKFFLWLACFSLCACSPSSNEDYREAGRSINRTLTKELQSIHSHDELVQKLPKLEKLFSRLADVMIGARKFQLTHIQSASLPLTKEDQQISDQLRVELNRIFIIPRGKELVERSQQQALDKLDRFEHRMAKYILHPIQ